MKAVKSYPGILFKSKKSFGGHLLFHQDVGQYGCGYVPA